MFFFNKVLLPLIRNEQTIPVCIVDRKEGSQWQLNTESLSVGGKDSKQGESTDHSGFLPSELVTDEMKGSIIKAFKEIVGKVSLS